MSRPWALVTALIQTTIVTLGAAFSGWVLYGDPNHVNLGVFVGGVVVPAYILNRRPQP
jgi:hypothetical protein